MELLYWFFEMGASFVEGYMALEFTRIFVEEKRTKIIRRREIIIALFEMLIVTVMNCFILVSIVTTL